MMRLNSKEITNFFSKIDNIQKKYDFNIPKYVLDEIVNNNDKDNLNEIINLAVMNRRLSKTNANILKNDYVFFMHNL